MDITAFTKGLEQRDGIWFSEQPEKEISYPAATTSLLSTIESKSYWFTTRNKIITILAHRFCIKKEFVDIGGGNGIVSEALDKAGFETCIIEPHINGISKAKEKGLKNLINASFAELNLPDGSIPNAGLFDVIEHISDDHSFLTTIHKALSDEGNLLITVPAYSFLWSQADIEAGHFRRYTLKTMTKVLHETMFTVVYKSYLFSFLVPAIFIFKTIPFIFFKNKKTTLSLENEHIPKSRIQASIINGLCKREVKKISKGGSLLFGSSCVIVAQKRKN